MSFIYIFLPSILLLCLVTKKEFHNIVLLIASLIFYAWGEPKYLAILLLTVIINYLGALGISEVQKRGYRLINDKLILTLTIIADLSFLIYFKYFNFIVENCNNLLHSDFNLLKVIMPIGISFYTFQAMSYLIDVYRKECNVQKNIFKLALYICLFPQLVAGPIVKYHDIEEQLDSREVDFDKVNCGVKRFIIGLSKKVLIANILGAVADKIFAQDPQTFSVFVAWLGAFAYTFQLYFDFSGYSDMAIGLCMIFGFRIMENFNYPDISKSVTEFWHRWHISLSTWFKQYVYVSIGGNRNGKLKTVRNLGIVFLLTGIWHGAEWTFIVWGIWHGFFIILEKILNIKDFESKKHLFVTNVLRHLYCILVFVVGWVIFRSVDLSYAGKYLMNMFGLLQLDFDKFYNLVYYVEGKEILVFIVAILCSVPIFKNKLEIKNMFLKALTNAWLLCLFVLSTMAIAVNTYNPFIYFRF